MDSMDVNKGIAAVATWLASSSLTGLIGDNLVRETEPSKPALDIKVSSVPAAEASKPEPLQPISPLLGDADPAAGEAYTKRSAPSATPSTTGESRSSARISMGWWLGRTTEEASTTRRPWKSLGAALDTTRH